MNSHALNHGDGVLDLPLVSSEPQTAAPAKVAEAQGTAFGGKVDIGQPGSKGFLGRCRPTMVLGALLVLMAGERAFTQYRLDDAHNQLNVMGRIITEAAEEPAVRKALTQKGMSLGKEFSDTGIYVGFVPQFAAPSGAATVYKNPDPKVLEAHTKATVKLGIMDWRGNMTSLVKEPVHSSKSLSFNN